MIKLADEKVTQIAYLDKKQNIRFCKHVIICDKIAKSIKKLNLLYFIPYSKNSKISYVNQYI